MRAKGFQPVGKDFPVFLHPKTHEEYALARTERKTGKGYKGFHFYAAPDVTLEEDLLRRDLTINAMAKSSEGELIDPYHGQADLNHKIFRHVSPAFSEDPVRILRVARFATSFPNFSVHPETNALMQSMVTSGEIDALVPERTWKEFSRALIGKQPRRFFEVLVACDALSILFPEIKMDQLALLDKIVKISEDPVVRFSVFLHGLTVQEIKMLCNRFHVPVEYSDLALLTEKYYKKYFHLDIKNAEQLWEIIKLCDGFRRPERFEQWISVCKTISGKDHRAALFHALKVAQKVDTSALLKQGLKGLEFAEALKKRQIEAIAKLKR